MYSSLIQDRGVLVSFIPTIRISTLDGSSYWSSNRNSTNNAWNSNGNNGNFNNNNLYNTNVSLPSLNYQRINMITLDNIIEAYMLARANKRKSADQVEFELHWEANCLKLYEDIVNRRVQPTAYTFIIDYPKPREVFASDMSTRILHHYLDMRLRVLLERKLSPHTYNNRIGMGQTACQNAVISDIYEVSKGFTRDAWIIKVDLSGCFPNIRQDIAYKQFENLIIEDYISEDKDELLYILQICIFSYPTLHCYRKSDISKWRKIKADKSLFNKPLGTGAAIGHLIWQCAVNYYFNDIDWWLIENGIKFERFVDDFFVITNNKSFLLMLPELRRRLSLLGASLNETKLYCQHYTKGVECLGTHIKMDRIYINNRIVNRALIKTKRLNKRIDERHVEKLLSTLNSYLGICKNLNGFN